MTTVLLGCAGALGVLARFGVGKIALTDALWSTAAVNVAGSFLLGLIVAGPWLAADTRDVVGIGFLGGFTTFSTFSVQVVQELDAGQPQRAAALLAVSVLGGIIAAAAGYVLGRAAA